MWQCMFGIFILSFAAVVAAYCALHIREKWEIWKDPDNPEKPPQFVILLIVVGFATGFGYYGGLQAKDGWESWQHPESELAKSFRKELEVTEANIAVIVQAQLDKTMERLEPSPRDLETAKRIPSNADPYALALKAIAEKRFDDARKLLSEPQEIKETELSKIYEAKGQTEIFAGRYADASNWYQKALALLPDDVSLLSQAALALHLAGKYSEAEPHYKRTLAIREKALGPEHPKVGTILNNLAALYEDQGKYAEAEPLYKRALAITEKALDPGHPNVGTTLNNLAELYHAQGKYAEEESLHKRVLAIHEKALGPGHPNVGTTLNNLAELYRAQGKYAEAEPLNKRALAITEKALGPGHPNVGAALNNCPIQRGLT